MDELLLYRRLIAGRIRSDWQYRTSFLTFATAQALVTSLEFAAVLILLQLGPDLAGWSRTDVVFLYALAATPFGIADVFVSSVERVGYYVQSGEFDRVLLRPTPALLQLSALEFELRRVGKLVPPVAVLVWAVPNVGIDWTVGRVSYLVMTLSCGAVLYGAIWILTSSLTFWAVGSSEAMNSFTYGGAFANEYPLHIFPGWIRAILGWTVPLAFVAYVPSIHLLGASNPLGLPGWFAYLVGPVAAVALAIALLVWRSGIRHYQSTGS